MSLGAGDGATGAGGGGGGEAGVASPFGATIVELAARRIFSPQPTHFAVRPTYCEGTFIALPQCGHTARTVFEEGDGKASIVHALDKKQRFHR
jgi:hypothetical protein